MTTGTGRRSPSAASEVSSPVPAETPTRKPSGETSGSWLHHKDTPSTQTSSQSPSSEPNQSPSADRHSDDIEDDDDKLLPLNPRRFTPTLHASLVSEILNLRRETESKTRTIDILERSLDESRTESEDLGVNLSQSTKEARSLKHQLGLLEGGSSSALSELAKERDDALENISDMRRKLDQSQKKSRSREEDIERRQMLWDRERESSETERRNLERKVHVVENRLKTVLNEVAAAQAAGSSFFHSGTPKANGGDSSTREGTMTGKGSDSASVYSNSPGRRRTSVTSMSTDGGGFVHNSRYSVISMAFDPNGKGDGLNLAQELDFDGDDGDEEDGFGDGALSDSPGALPEERPTSANSQVSHAMGNKARKILGLALQDRGSTDADVPADTVSPSTIPPSSPFVYHDMGVQYSPPPSPKATTTTSTTTTSSSSSVKDSSTLTLATDMVSSSCQTVGDLPSPPWTPKIGESPSLPPSPTVAPVQDPMVSTSTQTESLAPAVGEIPGQEKRMSLSPQDALSSRMEVPMIAIHPPGSEPPSPRGSVVLPPQTKSASCQTDTNLGPTEGGRSVAIQTEGIRIDQRPVKLPASLLPSAIPDLPLANEKRAATPSPTTPTPTGPPPYRASSLSRSSSKESKKLPPLPVIERPIEEEGKQQPYLPPITRPSNDEQRTIGHIQTYPGNNDNGPLSKKLAKPSMRRPPRSSSLFAGFEEPGDNNEESFEKSLDRDLFSDDDLFNRPTATYTLRKGKMVSTPTHPSLDNTTLPEIEEHLSDAKMQLYESTVNNNNNNNSNNNNNNDITTIDPAGPLRGGQRSGSIASSTRRQDIRRAAMITNGAAAHQRKRTHSSSEPSTDSGSNASVIAPPIPVPARRSSRKFPAAGSDGQRSPSTSTAASVRTFSDRPRPPITRKSTVRRARSATTTSQGSQPDPFVSQGSPGMSLSSSRGTAESPRPAPLLFDDMPEAAPLPRQQLPRGESTWRDAPYYKEDPIGRERQGSTAASIQQTSVVDAIAQTMIGEWMFKYIRRKSFGSNDQKDNWEGRNAEEVSASITNSGVRHKRWVWLAPYERVIMWSNKQPTTGPALLGKSGRKLTIKNVLDVKDDNPLPKGSSPQSQFNRSILVLTPQRALKFTATSLERHYVWLSALSFLSHSSMGTDELELASIPPIPQGDREPDSPVSAPNVRKNPIRDSFKAARGLPRGYPKSKLPFGNGKTAPPLPEVPVNDYNTSINGLDPIDDNDNDDDHGDSAAAAPPTVPMFKHSRKRSNTAPRMGTGTATISTGTGTGTVRKFSSFGPTRTTTSSQHSGGSGPPSVVGSIDAFYPPPTIPTNNTRTSFSRRTSEASGPSSLGGTSSSHYADSAGTMRMEAFIAQGDVGSSSSSSRQQSRRRPRKPSGTGTGTSTGTGMQDMDFFVGFENNSETSSRLDDPFRGF